MTAGLTRGLRTRRRAVAHPVPTPPAGPPHVPRRRFCFCRGLCGFAPNPNPLCVSPAVVNGGGLLTTLRTIFGDGDPFSQGSNSSFGRKGDSKFKFGVDAAAVIFTDPTPPVGARQKAKEKEKEKENENENARQKVCAFPSPMRGKPTPPTPPMLGSLGAPLSPLSARSILEARLPVCGLRFFFWCFFLHMIDLLFSLLLCIFRGLWMELFC